MESIRHNLGRVNVGNNHTYDHLIEAIIDNDLKFEVLYDLLSESDSDSDVELFYVDNYGNHYQIEFDSYELYTLLKK